MSQRLIETCMEIVVPDCARQLPLRTETDRVGQIHAFGVRVGFGRLGDGRLRSWKGLERIGCQKGHGGNHRILIEIAHQIRALLVIFETEDQDVLQRSAGKARGEIQVVHGRLDRAAAARTIAQYIHRVDRRSQCGEERIVRRYGNLTWRIPGSAHRRSAEVAGRRMGRKTVAGAIDGGGLPRQKIIIPVACHVADGPGFIDRMLNPAGNDIHFGLEPIIGRQAVERIACNGSGLVEQEGEPIVRQIVFFLVQVLQRTFGIRIDAKGDGRRYSPALCFDKRPPFNQVFLAHDIDTGRRMIGKGMVHVGCGARLRVGTGGGGDI